MFASNNTDSWSLGEIQALVVKAARGSGKHWGWSEEAAFAVDWLEQRRLPGTRAISALLATESTNPNTRNNSDTESHNQKIDKSKALCPLDTGMQLSDGSLHLTPSAPLQLYTAQPLLLLPFLSLLLRDARGESKERPLASPEASYQLSLQFDSTVITMDTDTNETVVVTLQNLPRISDLNDAEISKPEDHFADHLITDEAECSVQLLALSDSAIKAEKLTAKQHKFDANPSNRVCQQAQSAIAKLDQLAQLTYAPVTEESRHKGAGAGLTDND